MMYTYSHAVLGGTFDHFHAGHEHFIRTACMQSDTVTIGLTQNMSESKPFPESIEAYPVREQNLKRFLQKEQLSDRAEIIPIYDIFGTTLHDKTIEAIFVTESTRANTETINEERRKHALPLLETVIVPYIRGDDGEIISSHRIRAGEIDRKGNSYLRFFLKNDIYILPETLRRTLQQPAGKIISGNNDIGKILQRSSFMITVGDIVSAILKGAGYIPAVSIIDYKTRRHDLETNSTGQYFHSTAHMLNNPAGTINKEIAQILHTSFGTFLQKKETQAIAVSGEEDLLALPAILFAPLNSFVIYGQYNTGMVVIEISEEKKLWVKSLLEQFR